MNKYLRFRYFPVLTVLLGSLFTQIYAQEIFSYPIDFELKKKFPPGEPIQIIGTWEESYDSVIVTEIRSVDNEAKSKRIPASIQEIKGVGGRIASKRWSVTVGPYDASENIQYNFEIKKLPSVSISTAYEVVFASIRERIGNFLANLGTDSISLSRIRDSLRPAFQALNSDKFAAVKHSKQLDQTQSLGDFLYDQFLQHFNDLRNAQFDAVRGRKIIEFLPSFKQDSAKLLKLHDSNVHEDIRRIWTENGNPDVGEISTAKIDSGSPAANSYKSKMSEFLKKEIKARDDFYSIVEISNFTSTIISDPYAVTIDQINDWIGVGVGYAYVPALKAMVGTFNVSILFTKHNRDFPYRFDNLFDYENRLNLNVGTKLFTIDDPKDFPTRPVYCTVGYQLNRFVGINLGPIFVKRDTRYLVFMQYSIAADITVAKYVLNEFAKAVNIFSSDSKEQ